MCTFNSPSAYLYDRADACSTNGKIDTSTPFATYTKTTCPGLSGITVTASLKCLTASTSFSSQTFATILQQGNGGDLQTLYSFFESNTCGATSLASCEILCIAFDTQGQMACMKSPLTIVVVHHPSVVTEFDFQAEVSSTPAGFKLKVLSTKGNPSFAPCIGAAVDTVGSQYIAFSPCDAGDQINCV